jgi:hypothetical protein
MFSFSLRKLVFLWLSLVVLAVSAAELLPVASYSFTDPTMQDGKNTAAYADPGFVKLTDGKLNPEQAGGPVPRIVWRKRDVHRQPLKITFNFPTEVKLEQALLHFSRGPRSYGIKDIKLIGADAQGQKIPLGVTTLNHPYNLPEGEAAYGHAVVVAQDSTPIQQIEVVVSSTGGFLSLTEVQFFGQAQAARKVELPKRNPMEKLLAGAAPGLRLYRDGQHFVLENDYALYVLDPLYSGAVNFAWDKVSQANLVLYAAPNTGFGPIFCDRFWPNARDVFRYQEYQGEVVSDSADKKQVRFTGYGKSGIFANVQIVKTYTLTASSSTLAVDYMITNGLDNVVPLNYGYWMLGGFQSQNGFQRLVPGLYGVEQDSSGAKQFATRDLSSGWFGALDGDLGLAVIAPFELLKEVYFWGGNPYNGTVECKLGVYPIKAGEALAFRLALCPFNGIGVPSKVNELMAGSLGLEPEYAAAPEKLTLKLRFFTPGQYTLRLSEGLLQDGKVEFSPGRTEALPVGNSASLDYTLQAKAGTVVVKAEVLAGEQVVFAMEGSSALGKSSGNYKLTPDGEQKPDASAAQDKPDLDFHSLEIQTEHFDWAKPYAGGRPKVLAINGVYGGIRDMIEMAQRFDFELTTNYIAGLWRLSGHVMSLNYNTCLNILDKVLDNKFDVILISHEVWDLFSKSLAEKILSKVEQGTGLILCSPGKLPEALQPYLSAHPKKQSCRGQWQAVSEHPLLSGLPFEALPPTRARCYQTSGEVLAHIDQFPLLCAFKYGQGQVYALSYLVSKPNVRRGDTSLQSSFFLPLLTYDPPEVEYKYYEYQMALLGRLLFAAAGRSSNVSAGKLTAAPGNCQVELQAVQNQTAQLEITLRDKFSQVVATRTQEITLQSGSNQTTCELPLPVLQGLYFTDVRVIGKNGVEWWGSAVFDHAAAGKILDISLEQRIYRKDENLSGTLTCQGAGSPQVRLLDTYGNEFARASGTEFTLPLADCRTPVCWLEADLLAPDGQLLDRQRSRVELYQKPDRRIFNIAQGWPGVSEKGQLFLLDDYLKQLKRFGITCTSGSSSSRDTKAAEDIIRNQNILYLSANNNISVGGKRPYDVTVKPQSKFDLLRRPCLSDPEFRARLDKEGGQLGATWPYGVLTVAGPDEANMFSEWDGCFSEHCQKEFRRWLQEQYGDLEALNRSWCSDFKAWDEVVAMTAGEVRSRPSFAPWVDHRTFNDWNRAEAHRLLVNSIYRTDPDLAYSLSGTSETNPTNAWDFYQLMPHLKALASYTGEQTIQHRCFSPHKLLNMPWLGYDSAYSHLNAYILNVLFRGATGLNIYGNFNITPDYRFSPRGADLIRALDNYRNGPAEAITRSDWYAYPIAFLYSPASIKVDWMLNLAGVQRSTINGYKLLVEDASLNYDYVAYGQLENSDILDNYKILFLPTASAMSDREIAAVQKFVQQGGILVADMQCASFDQHGKPRTAPGLQEVFGLTGSAELQAIKGILRGAPETINSLSLNGLQLDVKHVETGLTATTAKSLATVEFEGRSQPAVFVNEYGQGLAVYLAASAAVTIGDWQEMRYARNNAANMQLCNEFFAALNRRVGISALAKAPDLPATTLLLRQQKSACFLGLVRNAGQTANMDPEPKEHNIYLRDNWHIYDLLKGKYLTYGKEFKYVFAPDTQSAFVLLPYKPEKLSAKVSGRDRRWQVEFLLHGQASAWADHLLRLEVFDPAGEISPAYSQLLFATENRATLELNLPLNAPAEGWKLTAVDVLTGLNTSIALTPTP